MPTAVLVEYIDGHRDRFGVELHEAGRRVPADVSVVGFDDMAESADFWPALTTVRQHFDRVGVLALRTLIAGIERRDPDPAELVSTELIVRDSSAPPPRA